MRLNCRRRGRIRWSMMFALVATVALPLYGADVKSAKKPDAETKKKITFDEHIQPIFRAKCFSCHNQDKRSGDLDLTNYTNMLQGGGSGEVIERGAASDSYLYLLVSHSSEPYMPPKSEKLPPEMLTLIEKWIDGGALENAGSNSFVRPKPKFDFNLSEAPTERPQNPAMPGRISLQPTMQTKRASATTALATSPWSPLIAVAGQKQVLLYDSGTLEPRGVLPFPEGSIQVLKFSRNGSLLLAGGGRAAAHGLVVVWNVQTGERVFEIGDELDVVLAADISADQSMIALGSSAKIVRCYSTTDGELLYEIPKKHTDWIYQVAFSPDGVLLATADRNGGLLVWEAETGREYLVLKAHSKAVTGLSWRADSNVLASASEDRSVRLWEMENGKQIKNWTAHGDGTASIEFTREGQLVSCGRDKATKLWDQNGKQLRAFPAFPDLALRVTYCDQTHRVVAGDWTGEIRVWDAKNGKQLGGLASNPPMLEDRLAASKQQLASRQSELQKLKLASQNARAAADKTKSDLATTQKSIADLQQKTQAHNATIKQQQQSVTELTAVVGAAGKQAALLQQVVPLLTQTVATAEQTSGKDPADKPLVEIAAQLKKLLQQRTAALSGAQKTVAEKTPQLEQSKSRLAEAQKQLSQSAQALDATQKRAKHLTDSDKTAQAKAATAAQAASAAAQALAETQKQVDRWTVEIAVVQKIDVIRARQREHDEKLAAVGQATVLVDQARSQLSDAQKSLGDAEQKATQLAQTVSQIQHNVAESTAARDMLANQVSALNEALPFLREASTRLQEAVKKAGEDKQLASVASELKAVVQNKTSALAAAREASVQKAAEIAKSQQQLAGAEKQANQAADQVAAAKRVIAEKSAVLKSLESQLATARQQADNVAKSIAALRTELDSL